MQFNLEFPRRTGDPDWPHLMVKDLGPSEQVDLLEEPERAEGLGKNLVAQMGRKTQNTFVKKVLISWNCVRLAVEPPFGTGNALKRIDETMELLIAQCKEGAERSRVT